MLWSICGTVSAILIIIGAVIYFTKKKDALRIVVLLLCLFAATYIIYIPYYHTTYNFLMGILSNFIHLLQVVTIDTNITDLYDEVFAGIGNPVIANIYVALLGILHISLPTLSALTAVTILFRCFSSLLLFFANHRKRPMFVFSEYNERSLQLCKSLAQTKCDIVFAGSNSDSLTNENNGLRGVIFKEESISEIDVHCRKNKEVYFFCIAEDEDQALSQSLQLIDKYAGKNECVQTHIHIYEFSRHQDFSVFVDSANKGRLDVQCINEYEMLVYDLLDRYPLTYYAKSGIHVLLHGLNELNIVALKAIAWCGQLNGFSLKISVAGIDIEDKIRDLELTTPGLFTDRYSIRFYNCRNEKEVIDAISKNCADANYIITSGQSDNTTMQEALTLRRLFYKLDREFQYCPPIFCYIQDPSKFHITQNLATAESNPKRKVSYDLIPFGSLEDVYAYKKLVNSDLELLAKNIHLAYEEIFSDGEINVEEALKRYSIFEVNKRSNRANALHIRYKLNLLGLDYTAEDTDQAVTLKDFYTDDVLEQLSISEHDRWMAFLETEGWIPSTKEDVLSYRNSGISRGRHNCPVLKMHPYICEYEKLEALSLELEGKDTRVYDSELIVRIPDILGDKWNHAKKKFTIIDLRKKQEEITHGESN